MEIVVGDQMTTADAKGFAQEYSTNVASLTPAQYVLEINCKGMKVLSQEMAQLLEKAIMMYKQTGFKKVVFLMPNETILKMQISRLCRKVGLDMEIVI